MVNDEMNAKKSGVGGRPVQVPTVGRIVHFYTKDVSKHSNGQGEGPYPALVSQVFPNSGSMANLKVFPPFGAAYDEGSVAHGSEAETFGHMQWWDWAPRVANSIERYGEGVPAETTAGAGAGGTDTAKDSPQ